jgi:hypothetical protein
VAGREYSASAQDAPGGNHGPVKQDKEKYSIGQSFSGV